MKIPTWFRPYPHTYGYGMDFSYFTYLGILVHPIFFVRHAVRVQVFLKGLFLWVPPFHCPTFTTLWNVDIASSVILSSLWKLTFFSLSSSRTLLILWVMSLNITVRYTQEFRRIEAFKSTSINLADNEVGSPGP